MGLEHLVFPEAPVSTPGGDFTVRGLTVEHILFIVKQHHSTLRPVFDSMMEKIKSKSEFHADEVGGLIMPFIESCPKVVAQVIACGSGNPSETSIAARLPFTVQVEAIEKIIDLTFQAEGGPKKFVETVIRLAQGVNGLLPNPSQTNPKS